jgi:plastocyanin
MGNRIRSGLGWGVCALLGAAVVVLPAQAGSETAPAPAVVAENVEYLGTTRHYWTPPLLEVQPGASVAFSNPTGVSHGIEWVSTPGGAPSCTPSVPVGNSAAASAAKWSGSCTFAAAGSYVYYCTVHGAAMSGRITVAAPTTTGTTTTTGSTGSAGTTSTPPGGGGAGGPALAPATAALSALRLAASRHGSVVRGSVQVSRAAAGGTLTIVLRARLGGRHVQVGRVLRAYVSAGSQSWSITLSARARRVLHARGRLALSAKVSLTPPGGAAVTLTGTLTLHG